MEGEGEVTSTCAELNHIFPGGVRTMVLPTRRTEVGFWATFLWYCRTIYSFLVIHVIGFYFTLIELCTPHLTFPITDNVIKASKGRWAVVTGGARGIGLEVVRKLYQSRMNVIIGCRDYDHGKQVSNLIQREFYFGNDQPTILVCPLDLNSMASVKLFAISVLHATSGCIHVLVNNAGVMFPSFELTEDALGNQIQTNHLGHFALIYQLMPALRRGGMTVGNTFARVINVSSVAHYGTRITSESAKASILSRKNDFQIYMDSKFCQIVTSVTWNKKLIANNIPVRILNVHPGIVNTDLYQNVFYYKLVAPLMSLFYKTPRQGADCVVFAALSPTLENKTVEFLVNSKEKNPLPRVQDLEVQVRIWLLSCMATGTPADPFKIYDFGQS